MIRGMALVPQVVNGLVTYGVDGLAGIRAPGPGPCANCGQTVARLDAHYSVYGGSDPFSNYDCYSVAEQEGLPGPWDNNGQPW